MQALWMGLLLLAGPPLLPKVPDTTWFLVGVDLSSLPLVEQSGGTFRDNDTPIDPLRYLRHQGFRLLRLRLFHGSDGPYGLKATLQMAQRGYQAGFLLLLDLHYSDTWADPGHQQVPRAWQGLPFKALQESVRLYTAGVLRAFDHNGIPVAFLQIGNEVDHGFLWDYGRIQGREGWHRFRALLKAALQGVQEAAPSSGPPRIVIHTTPQGAWAVFPHLEPTLYDMIGLSYYPWWHGGFQVVQEILENLVPEKPVLLVETAYPWTLGYADTVHNLVGLPGQLLPGYPATPEGQARFWQDLLALCRSTHRCKGVIYWEPAWLPTPNRGSPWENLTLFDFSGHPLPALRAGIPLR